MKPDIKQLALHTVQNEAEAIANLTSFIDEAFVQAVNMMHACSGRIVVSGVGKSAIVAQKMVATFNSTGTPALFMHAADAIHGDLGMIQQEDVVLLISKSGESPEIKLLTPLIRSFGNQLIAMAGSFPSYLTNHADVALNTTVSKEACTNNLAPTSSTTAQMVMGDALAVCLMELNGFTGSDFAKYHPGGNLGKKLYLRIEDLYRLNAAPKVYENDVLKQVINEISQNRLGATAVLDPSGSVKGIITDGDVRRMLEKTDSLVHVTAKDMATPHPKQVAPEMLAAEALELMKQFDISQLIVTSNEGAYLGIVHLHDLVREGIL